MRKQDKYGGAVRIFEALSSVDEDLLERSSTSRKIIPYWKYARVVAACAYLVIVGFVTWYGSRILLPKGGYDNTDTTMQVITDADEGYKEEAIAEEVMEETNREPEEFDADMLDEAFAENNSTSQEDSYAGGTPVAPEEKALSEAEIREAEKLGEYVPDWIPDGYVFENGSGAEDGSIYARWSRGMDDIVIIVAWYEAGEESASRIADISRPETYDVHLYEIPYAQTVPEEYWQVFDHPIFLEKDFDIEVVEARMKRVADSGDTDTPRGRFSVLYDSGVLVSFHGDCDQEDVWQMFTSIGQ